MTGVWATRCEAQGVRWHTHRPVRPGPAAGSCGSVTGARETDKCLPNRWMCLPLSTHHAPKTQNWEYKVQIHKKQPNSVHITAAQDNINYWHFQGKYWQDMKILFKKLLFNYTWENTLLYPRGKCRWKLLRHCFMLTEGHCLHIEYFWQIPEWSCPRGAK